MGNDLGTTNGTGSEIKREDKEEGVCEDEGQSEGEGAAGAARSAHVVPACRCGSESAPARWVGGDTTPRNCVAPCCRSCSSTCLPSRR